jgi:hypothetical protein
MSEFLYAAIYDLSAPQDPSDKHRGLQSLKDQICRLHAATYSSLTLDTGAEDRYGDEEPSLFHLVRVTKRRTTDHPHTRDSRRRNTVYYSGYIETFSGPLHLQVRRNPH